MSSALVKPLDGGYGWVIVFCAFMLQGASCGISFSVGVFFVEWLESFEQTHDVTAWVGSLNTGIMFAGGPLASALINKIGHRYVAFAGGLLSSVGLVLASFSTKISHLFITYGVLGGLGVSFMFIPAAVVCGTYFEHYRPVAMGVATSGVGMFCLVMPPILRLAVENYGWRVAMICMSALSVQSCLFAYMLLPLEFWYPSNKLKQITMDEICKNETKINSENKVKIYKKIQLYLISLWDTELLCNIRFYIYFVNNALWNCGSLIILVMVPDYAITVGISKDKAAFLLSIIGLGGLIGRIGSGSLANIQCLKGFWVYTIATIISGFAIGLLPLFHQYAAFCTMCVIYGICFGAQCGVLAVTTIDLVGVHKLATAFGYIMVSHGLGALSGPPLAGILYEVTHGYDIPFYFGGGISIISALLACIIPCVDLKHKRTYGESVDIEVVV